MTNEHNTKTKIRMKNEDRQIHNIKILSIYII